MYNFNSIILRGMRAYVRVCIIESIMKYNMYIIPWAQSQQYI